MAKLMIQFRYLSGKPSIAAAAQALSIPAASLDANFGVIETDPAENLFTVLAEPDAAQRADALLRAKPDHHPAEGAFGDSRIAPTDPSEPDPEGG